GDTQRRTTDVGAAQRDRRRSARPRPQIPPHSGPIMNRLFLVFGLWFGLSVLSVLAHVEIHSTPAPVATARTLPRNYIVRTGDVMIPGVTGRYLKEEVREGAALTPEQLIPLP